MLSNHNYSDYLPPEYPSLQLDYREIWNYDKSITGPNQWQIPIQQEFVIEYSIWARIWHIIRGLLTCFCWYEELPERETRVVGHQKRIVHYVTETFTCKDKSGITPEHLRLIIAHFFCPYQPAPPPNTEIVKTAIEIYVRLGNVGRFSVTGRRTVVNGNDNTRLELSFNNGQVVPLQPLEKPVHSPPLPERFAGNVCGFGLNSGDAFVLMQDNLPNNYGNISANTHVTDQLTTAMNWLGLSQNLNREQVEATTTFLQYSFLRNIDLRSIPLEHSGYWMVQLHVGEDGRKSLRIYLSRPGGKSGGVDEVRAQAHQWQTWLQHGRTAQAHDFFRRLNVQIFSAEADGLVGFEFSLPNQPT